MSLTRGFASLGLIILFVIGLAAFAGAGWWATRNVPTTLNQAPVQTAQTPLTAIPCGQLPAKYDPIPSDAKPIKLDSEYLKDTQHVYLKRVDENRIIPGADPSTFRVPTDIDEFGMDDTHVYYAGCELAGADPSTFQHLPGGTFGRDKAHVYWRWYPLTGADAQHFESLPGDYGKDEMMVYMSTDLVLGADPATFESYADQNGNTASKSCGDNCGYSAQDKNHKYLGTKVVQ